MKQLLLCLTLTMFMFGHSYAAKKKSTADAAKSEISANVDKDSRKSAKALIKDGWQILPGRVELDKQIERSKIAEVSVDADGNNIYILGTHQAVGGNYSAAKNAATVRAKAELASNVKDHIKQIISDKNANSYQDANNIQLLDETVAAIMSNVDLELANVTNLLEIYRNVDNQKCEVMITLAVKIEPIVKKATETIDQELL